MLRYFCTSHFSKTAWLYQTFDTHFLGLYIKAASYVAILASYLLYLTIVRLVLVRLVPTSLYTYHQQLLLLPLTHHILTTLFYYYYQFHQLAYTEGKPLKPACTRLSTSFICGFISFSTQR